MNQKPQLGQIIWFMCKNAHVISAIQDSGKEPPIATSQQSQNVQVNHLDAFRRVQCVQCHRQTSQVAHSGTYPGHEEVEKTRLARQGMQLRYATLILPKDIERPCEKTKEKLKLLQDMAI